VEIYDSYDGSKTHLPTAHAILFAFLKLPNVAGKKILFYIYLANLKYHAHRNRINCRNLNSFCLLASSNRLQR
jgi:hypothetical protein